MLSIFKIFFILFNFHAQQYPNLIQEDIKELAKINTVGINRIESNIP